MSRREDIDNGIWSDPDFVDLSADSKLLYLWSFTNPACGMAGIYRAPLGLAAFQTGLTARRLDRAIAELDARRFMFWVDGVVWVRSRIKHLWNRHDRIAISVHNDVAKIPTAHPLRQRLLEEYGNDEDFGERLRKLRDPLSLKRDSGESQEGVT